MSIPRLDLTHRTPAEFSSELRTAFEACGFVAVTGHGIDDGVVERAYDAVRSFFGRPVDEKMRCHVPGGAGQRGYTPFGSETGKDASAPDLKEFWHVGPSLSEEARRQLAEAYPENVWPEGLTGFREALTALYDAQQALGVTLLRGVALSLDLPETYFDGRVDRGNSILRPIHYPPVAEGVQGVRAAAHEDINLLTLLVGSSEPGLEIQRRDGVWVPVTTLPGAIVCNVGDMLQRLTNHVLPSTTHRVVNPPAPWGTRSRYSMPFFLHFNADVTIAALDSCVSADRPVIDPPITAHAYLRERLVELGLLEGDD